jgi:hypothetical protein
MKEQIIEYPSAGATYCREEYGVYEYSTYPSSSVLAGQQKRVFLDSFATLSEAQAAYPEAEYLDEGGTLRQEPYLGHLPDEGDLY